MSLSQTQAGSFIFFVKKCVERTSTTLLSCTGESFFLDFVGIFHLISKQCVILNIMFCMHTNVFVLVVCVHSVVGMHLKLKT